MQAVATNLRWLFMMLANMLFEVAHGSLKAIQHVVVRAPLLTETSAAMVSVCDWSGSRLTTSQHHRTKVLRPSLASNHMRGHQVGHPAFDVRVSVLVR